MALDSMNLRFRFLKISSPPLTPGSRYWEYGVWVRFINALCRVAYYICVYVCSLLSVVKREPVQNERHCWDLVVICDCNGDLPAL